VVARVAAHVDASDRLADGIGWCEAYRAPAAQVDSLDPCEPRLPRFCDIDPADAGRIVGLRLDPAPADDLEHGKRLGALLKNVETEYATARLRSAAEWIPTRGHVGPGGARGRERAHAWPRGVVFTIGPGTSPMTARIQQPTDP